MNRKSVTEDRNRRTGSSKISSLGPGLYQAVMYPDIVHFKNKATGELQEINNSLVAVLDKLEGKVVYESIIPGVDKNCAFHSLRFMDCFTFKEMSGVQPLTFQYSMPDMVSEKIEDGSI